MAKINWERANLEERGKKSGVTTGNDELPFVGTSADQRRQRSSETKGPRAAEELKALIKKTKTKEWKKTDQKHKLNKLAAMDNCIKILEKLNNLRYLSIRLIGEEIIREEGRTDAPRKKRRRRHKNKQIATKVRNRTKPSPEKTLP